jgi:hypothetical protein
MMRCMTEDCMNRAIGSWSFCSEHWDRIPESSKEQVSAAREGGRWMCSNEGRRRYMSAVCLAIRAMGPG